jgi:hypothetical protein
MTKNQKKLLISKLRQPVHINYISEYIIKEDINKTKEILKILTDNGEIEESKYAKEYYVLSKENLQN